MFVIIGTQVRKEDIGCLPEPRICPRCRELVHMQAIRERRWFTAFWVPLFPVHKEEYFQCPSCGLTFLMSEVPVAAQQTLPDKSGKSAGASMLQKGARQAGRLAGRFQRYLDE